MTLQNFLPTTTFSNEQDAARALLGEAAEVLSQQGVDFVVLGGWIPFLFNRGGYPHPGTFDVDVLLNENTSRASVNAAADALCRNGYLRAPKNAFQFHRLLSVGGIPMVFHVDFLHRRYAAEAEDIILQWGHMTSIAGPGTDVIFTHSERAMRKVTVPSVHNAAETSQASIPFASELGFLSAKGRSAATVKRTRDAYDIFLVIKESEDYEHLVNRSAKLLSDGVFRISLQQIEQGFGSGALLENAVKYLTPVVAEADARMLVASTVAKYFQDVYAIAPTRTAAS